MAVVAVRPGGYPISAIVVVRTAAIAVFQAFELPYSKPHYSLAVLCVDSVGIDVRRWAAQEVIDEPIECLPLFPRRLREKYPTVDQVLEHVGKYVYPWAQATYTSIDGVERLHGQMRQDLVSGGRASGVTASVNRLCCQQMMAAHVDRGGCDIVSSSHPPPPVLSGGGVGSSAFLCFRNSRLRAFKEAVASDRPLTSHERQHVETQVASEWESIVNDDSKREYNLWLDLHRSQAASRRCVREPAIVQASADFSPLWARETRGSVQGTDEVVPLADMLQYVRSTSARERWAEAWRDNALRIASPRRGSRTLVGWQRAKGCLGVIRTSGIFAADIRWLQTECDLSTLP